MKLPNRLLAFIAILLIILDFAGVRGVHDPFLLVAGAYCWDLILLFPSYLPKVVVAEKPKHVPEGVPDSVMKYLLAEKTNFMHIFQNDFGSEVGPFLTVIYNRFDLSEVPMMTVSRTYAEYFVAANPDYACVDFGEYLGKLLPDEV